MRAAAMCGRQLIPRRREGVINSDDFEPEKKRLQRKVYFLLNENGANDISMGGDDGEK